MTGSHDPRVDDYLDALPPWQRDLCTRLRQLIHAAEPEIEETIKRTRQPYFVLQGNVCAFLATKDHVNLFVYDGALVPDPAGLVTAGHDNSTARTIAFWEGDPVDEEALTTFLQRIVANNRAGGWRAIKAQARAATDRHMRPGSSRGAPAARHVSPRRAP